MTPKRNIRKRFIVVNFLFLLIIVSCGNQQEEKKRIKPSELKEPLIEANKHVVKTEAGQIEDFLVRYKWPVKETGSGLKYFIYKNGDGDQAREGDDVVLEFTVKLINGEEIYSSSQKGPLKFTVGKGEVISGLEEGILLLRKGDQAKFIIPSHLGYGLLGDQDKIPPKATLIYDLKLKEIN